MSFAEQYDVAPIGTIAHEWVMGIAAIEGEFSPPASRGFFDIPCCGRRLRARQWPCHGLVGHRTLSTPFFPSFADLFVQTYPSGALHIALTDTFSTQPFFDDFVSDPVRARKWKGLRQDSGDPFAFIPIAIEAFTRVGADPKTSRHASLRTSEELTSEQSLSSSPTHWMSTAVSRSRRLRKKRGSDARLA